MIAFFWRIWASRYSRLLPRGSTWVQSAHSSSYSSSLSPEERDGEETRAPIMLLLLLLLLLASGEQLGWAREKERAGTRAWPQARSLNEQAAGDTHFGAFRGFLPSTMH